MNGRVFGFFVAAGLLRAFYLWFYALRLPFIKQPVVDGAFFDERARLLLTQGWPAGPFDVAPGYPGFVALVYRLAGPGPLAVAVIQAGLGALAVALAVALAERWFDRRTGLIAGILLLGTAALPVHESKLLPATLTMVLALLFALLAGLARGAHRGAAEGRALDRARADGVPPPPLHRGERGLAAAAGVTGALATLVEPALGLALTGVALGGLLEAARGYRRWTPVALYVLAAALTLLPTFLHNAAAGAPTPVTTAGGFDAWLALTRPPEDAALSAASPARLALRAAYADSIERAELGEPLSAAGATGYWSTRAIRALAARPLEALGRLGTRGSFIFLRRESLAGGSVGLEMARIPFLKVATLPFSLLTLVGLIGLAMAAGRFGAPRGTPATLAPAVWVLLALALAVACSPGDGSGRLALAPLAAIFTAHALARLDGAWQAGRRGEALAAAGICMALLASTWGARPWAVEPGRHDAALLVEAGKGFAAREEAAEAAAAWQEALRVDPEAVEAGIRLGQLALKQRDLSTAIHWYEQAARMRPRRFDVRNNLGILYYLAQRAEEATREMTAARTLRPFDAAPWFYLGLVAQKGGDLAGADSLFAGAIERDPRFAGGWVRRIEVALARQDPGLARVLADSAGARGIALPPELARHLPPELRGAGEKGN